MTWFADLGARLRQARSEQHLQRSELAGRTGLPERYLEALEAGDMSLLPNEVYARIYFLSYARELGLDTEELLREWPEPEGPAPEVVPESAAPTRWSLRATAALIAVAVLVWIVVQLRSTDDDVIETAVEPIADPVEPAVVAIDSADPAVVAGPQPGTITPPADTVRPVVPEEIPHILRISSRGQTWVVIEADGDTVEAQLLDRGQALSAEASRRFTLTVGRPQTVTVRLDDSTYTLPSAPGRPLVRHRIQLVGEGGP